jgi:hypothetical protein
MEISMRHILLATASALALTITAGTAMANESYHHYPSGTTLHDSNAVSQASKGGNAAASNSNALNDGSAQWNNSTFTSNNPWTSIKVVSKNTLNAHFGGHEMEVEYEGKKSGSGSISQSGNAFQNFAGINTMTQSTAQFNNNQAATSIAAYAPVNFGGGNTNN